MRILIYQNPDAGHERPRPDTLIESLQREGHDVEWRHIKQHRLSDPDTGPLDLVVAVGGDGSVGRTARQLIGGDLPIAVLPMGTANNLATVLDAGTHDLAERIAAWTLVPFDAGTLEGVASPTGSSKAWVWARSRTRRRGSPKKPVRHRPSLHGRPSWRATFAS